MSATATPSEYPPTPITRRPEVEPVAQGVPGRSVAEIARANGHGHVWPRADPRKCGGPASCARCREELQLRRVYEPWFDGGER